MHPPDICIAGAGVIGLSLALELDRRGLAVIVLEAGEALGQASTAAAGMLAADDPLNPSALHDLAGLSLSLYPGFLDRIYELCGLRVPFQTFLTLQASEVEDEPVFEPSPAKLPSYLVSGERSFLEVRERSIDPRQLASALLTAVRATSIRLVEHCSVTGIAASTTGVTLRTAQGILQAGYFVDCMGAWSPAPVVPVKGQMLSVLLPTTLPLDCVVRTADVYVVPRTQGPNAGRVLIGATVENAGFDKTLHAADMLALHARASALLPELAQAVFVESWAGLRPTTVDHLPVLDFVPGQSRSLLATGHFRNGILLAPATALVIADLITGVPHKVDLSAFLAGRSGLQESTGAHQ